MIDVFGWIGSNLFAFCGLPQCIKVIKDGNSKGISKTFTWMWISGEICMQIYVFGRHGFDFPLLWNYWANTIFVLVILKYTYFPRR